MYVSKYRDHLGDFMSIKPVPTVAFGEKRVAKGQRGGNHRQHTVLSYFGDILLTDDNEDKPNERSLLIIDRLTNILQRVILAA